MKMLTIDAGNGIFTVCHKKPHTNKSWYILYFNTLYLFCQEQTIVGGVLMRDILADRLKKCRKQKGYTQAQVAIYCDITEKAYQNYELKTRLPKIDVLVRLADLYGVSIDYLVGRNNNK